MSVFSENLKNLIDFNNITQRQLAHDLGLTTASVSRYCSGEQMPRIDIVNKIADYFSVTTSDLFTENTPKNFADGKTDTFRISIPVSELQDAAMQIKIFHELEKLSISEKQDIMQYIQFLKSKRTTKDDALKEDN